MKNKYYHVRIDLAEGMPTYTFVVIGKTLVEALDVAIKELRASYPDYDNIYPEVRETTAEQLLLDMTIN